MSLNVKNSDCIHIVHQDCLLYLQELIESRIQADLILCDPPFKPFTAQYKQVHKETQNKLDEIPTPDKEHYDAWWELVCSLVQQIIKPQGWFIWKSDAWTAKSEFYPTQKYFDYASERIWDKGKIGLGYYIRNQHEHLEFYRPKNSSNNYIKHVPGRNKKAQKWHGSSQGLSVSSMQYVNSFNDGTLGKTSKQEHINETPKELWEENIDWYCPPDGIVLDPFMGSGSVGKAVIHLNQKPDVCRHYYGCELVAKNFQIAKKYLLPNTILTQLVKKEN